MFERGRLLAMVVTLLGLAPLVSNAAHAFELSGAWASDADLCPHIFIKKGGQIEFAELSDLFGSGFLIDGNGIRGKAARCTITSKKQDGDSIEISAACATSIMTQNANFNVKVLDDDHLVRSFPEISGMNLKYTRCKL